MGEFKSLKGSAADGSNIEPVRTATKQESREQIEDIYI